MSIQTNTPEFEPEPNSNTSSAEEAEVFVGSNLENENQNQNQDQNITQTNTKDERGEIVEATQKFINSDFKAPKRFEADLSDKMSLDEIIERLSKQNNKFENKMATYEAKLNGEINTKIKPKIEAVYDKAREKAREFESSEGELKERSKTLANYLKKTNDLWKSEKLTEAQYLSLLEEITREKNQLDENLKFHALLKEEVSNLETTDPDAELIQTGRFILEQDQKHEKIKLVDTYLEKLNNAQLIDGDWGKDGQFHKGVAEIFDEAQKDGLVKEITKKGEFDHTTGKWKKYEKPVTKFVWQIPEAKAIVDRCFKKGREIRALWKEIDKAIQSGEWISYNSKRTGVARATKINHKGRPAWMVDKMGFTGDLTAGIHDRLPGWLFFEMKKREEKTKNTDKGNFSQKEAENPEKKS